MGLNVGNWFDDDMVKELANMENSLFLHDWWLKASPLCNYFRRFFKLTENRYMYAEDMCRLGLGVEGVGWRWPRRLYVWEEKQVVYCCSLLDNI